MDIAHIAKKVGIHTVMVTNGYIDKEARKQVFKNIDAANVDLKAFSEDFYYRLTNGHLQPVLDTLIWLKNETDAWIEITNLIIPHENDSADEIKRMCEWILENLGNSVPLHFTAFHPDFKMTNYPPTPYATLRKAREIALKCGLNYVYVGNVHDPEGQTTFCPGCGRALIKRDWYSIPEIHLQNGKCPYCTQTISGRWQ